jgi:hypothetical protein
MRFEASRLPPFFFMLKELFKRGWVPESVFTIYSEDAPAFVGNLHVPTLTFEGYMASSQWLTVPIPTPHLVHRELFLSNYSSLALERSQQVAWEAKAETIMYADGHPWRSIIRADPYTTARITVRELAKSHQDVIRLPRQTIPFRNWAEHKYALFIDGVGPSGRMPSLLGLNSTVFIPDPAPNGLTWPMALLQPWVHYVPVLRNLSDLIDKVLWAHQHDKAAHRIAKNSAALTARVLSREGMVCAARASLAAVNEAQAGMRVFVRPGVDHVCPLDDASTVH